MIAHRFFYALLPPAREARRIADAAERFRSGSPVAISRYHVTLAITDDHVEYPEALAAAMIGAAAGAAPEMEAGRVVLDRAAASDRSVALRPARSQPWLSGLSRRLVAGMSANGVPLRAGWRFNPHLTLVYREGGPFAEAIPPIAWAAEEFVLIHSVVGRTQHNLLGRWRIEPPLRLFA